MRKEEINVQLHLSLYWFQQITKLHEDRSRGRRQQEFLEDVSSNLLNVFSYVQYTT